MVGAVVEPAVAPVAMEWCALSDPTATTRSVMPIWRCPGKEHHPSRSESTTPTSTLASDPGAIKAVSAPFAKTRSCRWSPLLTTVMRRSSPAGTSIVDGENAMPSMVTVTSVVCPVATTAATPACGVAMGGPSASAGRARTAARPTATTATTPTRARAPRCTGDASWPGKGLTQPGAGHQCDIDGVRDQDQAPPRRQRFAACGGAHGEQGERRVAQCRAGGPRGLQYRHSCTDRAGAAADHDRHEVAQGAVEHLQDPAGAEEGEPGQGRVAKGGGGILQVLDGALSY